MTFLEQKTIDSIRILTLDAIETAKSGHPGLPFGAAPTAYTLFSKVMKHNPKSPQWHNRDRFVLSAGHGSMMMYALLHLFQYGLPLDELKRFRQWQSKTPGHPENTHTAGIEVTTGPLGAGVSMAVGLAMAEAHLAATFNRDNYPVVDHYTYTLVGEGCLMEGVSAEALSLAGTLKLDKLIVLYDSNKITIEGHTDLAFQEDILKRMEAYGFNTFVVEDGNDIKAIYQALEAAKADKSAPSFIEIKTVIGYGMPTQGTSKAHSDPMGADKAALTRKNLGWENENLFEVDTAVYDHMNQVVSRLEKDEMAWNEMKKAYDATYPELAQKYAQFFGDDHELVEKFVQDEKLWAIGNGQAQATRNVSGLVLNYLKDAFGNLFGGSADLAPSNKTTLTGEQDFSAACYEGRNIHFGVRENGMAAIANGIAAHGGLTPYVATFFAFADYMKPMLRLSSIMEVGFPYIFTHDSIGVGEDGPTHQPIEQLSMLRAQPNLNVFRPADAKETVAGWLVALANKKTPTALALTRQNLPSLENSGVMAMKGGYVLVDHQDKATVLLMASGSEVSVMLEASKILEQHQIYANVVSMPCMELFEQQNEAYKASVLPSHLTLRIAMEAGATMSWYKYVGLEGTVIGIDHFGASAPANILFKEFGFTADNVVNTVLARR